MKNKRRKINLKVGEEVKIITGDDKGKVGLIKKIFHSRNKVIVEGINICYKHSKSTRPGQSGEIKRMEFPIDCSNIMKYKE